MPSSVREAKAALFHEADLHGRLLSPQALSRFSLALAQGIVLLENSAQPTSRYGSAREPGAASGSSSPAVRSGSDAATADALKAAADESPGRSDIHLECASL
jgi:hypothetical protein